MLPAGTSPEAAQFTELVDGRTVFVASLDAAGHWVGDLQSGSRLPYEPARIPSVRIGPLTLIGRTNLTYYALRGGPPLVAVRSSRSNATIWDLTVGPPLGTWPRGETGAQVQLTDGRTVTVPVPSRPARDGLSRRSEYRPTVPAEGADLLIPFVGPAPEPDQPDRESRESLAMSLQANDRFLHVKFHDYLAEPDRGPYR